MRHQDQLVRARQLLIYVECRIENEEFPTKCWEICLGIEKISFQPARWYHQWTQLLIWQNPWEANIWCVFSTSSRINHSASFCFPGFVDVAPLQGTNLFWIREGDESHDLSRHFLPFLSPFLFYKVRCFEGNDSWMRLNRGWESSIWMHNTVNRILSRKKESRVT